MAGIWNNEALLNRMTELWTDGVSGGDVAKRLTIEFGVEIRRNMVIAKVHRLRAAGAKLRGSDDVTRRRKKVVRKPAPPSIGRETVRDVASEWTVADPVAASLWTREPHAPMPPEESPSDYAKLYTLDELEKHHCKWPIGDPKTPVFGFCGKRRVHGKPYCESHCRRAYAPPVVRHRQPAPVHVPTFNDMEKV